MFFYNLYFIMCFTLNDVHSIVDSAEKDYKCYKQEKDIWF